MSAAKCTAPIWRQQLEVTMSNQPYHNPYQPPQMPVYAQQPGLPSGQAPAVWTWYKVYCGFMALLYLLFIAGGVALFLYGDRMASNREEKIQALIMGIMLPIIGVPLTLLFGTAVVLPPSKMAWILGFVTICIGLTSGCTMIPCVFLLVYWLKPETKAFLRVG